MSELVDKEYLIKQFTSYSKVVKEQLDKKINVCQDINNANKLLGIGEDGNIIPVEAPSSVKISTEDGNMIEQKTDGIYVPSQEIQISEETNNILVKKDDGLFVHSTDISTKDNNAIVKEDDGLFVEKTNISTDENNAIVTGSDNGIFVEDKTSEITELGETVKSIKKYQKYINTELDYADLKIETTDDPLYYTKDLVVPFVMNNGNMTYNAENHSIVLKAGKAYYIEADLFINSTPVDNRNSVYYCIYNLTTQEGIAWGGSHGMNTSSLQSDFDAITIYTPENDEEICVVVTGKNGTPYIPNANTSHCKFIVQEIGRQTIIDPIEHANEKYGIEDTPVGHIIAHMGNNAPAHYLICDGSEVSVSDYPYLAEHFKTEFGSEYYFGGADGVMNLPDLRGEFLRGTGTALRNSGSGAEVGEHQNGTSIPASALSTTGGLNIYASKNSRTSFGNQDSIVAGDTAWSFVPSNTAGWSSASPKAFTVRPTNTSVLYCIKASPTYFMQNIYTGNEEVVLWEGSNIINLDTAGWTVLEDNTITTTDSILNYDKIEIKYRRVITTDGSDNVMASTYVDVSDIDFNKNYISLKILQQSMYEVRCSFVDKTTFKMASLYVPEVATNFAFKIYKIVGYKTSLNENGELPNTAYTDEEITEAVTEILQK